MLDNLVNKIIKSVSREDDFVTIVRANDNGEEWAAKKIHAMFQEDVPNLILRIARARIQIYKNAAYRGDKRAQYYYGLSLQGINNNESLKFLVPLAEEGNVDAMTAIAMGYGFQGGYGENENESFKWNMKAAKLGDAYALNQIALHYIILHDYDKAFYWYRELANQNNSKGFCGMAKCFENRISNLERRNEGGKTEEIHDLYREAEKFYNLAIENVNNIDDEQDAYWGLGGLYTSWSYRVQQDNIRSNLLKLAIYYYMGSYDCGNEYGLQHAKEIATENKIYVDFNDVVGWARREKIIS